MSGEICAHERAVEHRHENDDRIRTVERCDVCGTTWYGCLAKRLDEEHREAWGPVGVWTYRLRTAP